MQIRLTACFFFVSDLVLTLICILSLLSQPQYLSGVGVAKQRKAIIDGLRSSIVDFSGSVSGSSTKDIMDLLLLTQYFDMIRDVGAAPHCKTTFVPTSRGGNDAMRNSLLQAAAGDISK